MNEIYKENDILLATMQKPDISNMDLFRNNITLENTLLLSKDQYKSIPLVKETFSKDGVFDNQLFDQAYNLAALKYYQMQEDLLMKSFVDNLEYSKTSFFRKPGLKTYATDYTGITLQNPLLLAVGLEGMNVKSDATKTEKEVALSHAIWDPVNLKWLEDSAESQNIFLKAFGESLIYAKYTKDGVQENPVTKETAYHSAGEFITDENGDYFTQLAGNIDLTSNIEIVKLQDILSDEDSWWNKIDFFDSDSREKSIPGVVMKTLVLTIPYFIPYLGPVYTTAAILVGLGENLPQIAKSFDWSPEGSAFSQSCNSVVNWFSKLSPSTSQYGQEHFWSIENLGTLTADIVGQLYQLRGLASLSLYLTKTNTYRKELELATKTAKYGEALLKYTLAAEQQAKIAKALSIGYMSLVQAGDVYNDALNAGYGRDVAGIATLMSTAAFFGIMNYNESLNGLGTWFLDKTTGYDREILRAPTAKLAKKATKEVVESDEMKKFVREGGKKFSNKMRNQWLNFWSKIDDAVRIGSEGAWTGAIAEGVEEISEEAVQDGVKGLIDGLNYLGYKSGKWGNENASFGGWSNVFSQEGLERYIETFIGGSLGGAMFHVTQNKVKPFTDSLFGIESDVLKPIDYDKIDIAILGKEEEYYKEIRKAVKFIDNRELDLGNPEDAKIYRAREVVASQLINEMKAIVDIVRSITDGADFNLIGNNFREAVQKSFKPLISSSGAVDYIESKWKSSIGQLANVLQEIQSREADLQNNRQGIDVEKTKELIKQKLEEAKQLREQVTGYFTGKSYIDTHDEASWLANKNLLKAISGSLTPLEFYENVLKTEGGPEYKDLVDSSTDPNKLSKELVTKQAEAFNKELEHQFDSSQLPDLYLRLPIINKAFKALAKQIGSDINLYLKDARKRTVVANTIKKMQQDRDIQLQQIEAMDLMEWLTPEGRQLYENGTEEQKAMILENTKQEKIRLINEAFSIPKLMEMLKSDPNAFSLSDRRNIDYLKVLESKGIVKLYEKLTDDQRKVLTALINSEFANVPLSTLSKQNVQTILDNIQGKLSSKDSYWGDLFFRASELEETSGVDADPNLLTFDINLDNFDESIEFIKLKDIEDILSEEDAQYISKEIYDFLLEQYKRLDAEFLSKLRGLELSIDGTIDSYLESPSMSAQKDIILAIIDNGYTTEVLTKLGVTNIDPRGEVGENYTLLKNIINSNLRSAKLIEKYRGSELVENNFLKALNKIAFNIIGDPKIVRDISKQVADWERSLKTNQGLQINSNLSKEALDHLHNVLAVLSTVVTTMTSRQDGENKIESIQERNQNFAKAMGQDGSDYFVIDAAEGDLMQAIIGEMSNKITVLKTVLSNIEQEQSVKFELVRKQMLDNQFKLFRFHIARKDDPLYVLELAEEIVAEPNVEFTDLEKIQAIFKYQQILYNRLQGDNFGGDLFKENYLNSGKYDSREKALVAFLIDIYGKENGKVKDDLFFIGDPATVANNLLGTNDTYASYFLTELVGLVGLDEDHSPKVIQDALHKAFTDLGLYPRQDLIYDLLLIIYGIIGKSAYSEFGNILEGLYNRPDTRGATKQYINNLIKVFGPAGSGKTALYLALIKALEHLGYNKESLPIVITAQSEYKVENIQMDLSKSELKNVYYSPLYNIISNLKTKSANWKVLETKLISRLVDLELRNKIISGEVTSIDLDPSNNKYGVLLFELSGDDVLIKLSGAKEELSDFEVQLTISKDQLKESGSFAGNLKFNFTGKSFNGLDISGTSLNNGLLVIDECTNLSPFEWQALNKLSTDKNFSILATGDLYQRGYQYNYFVGKTLRKAYIGDENILGLNAPALISVHRALSSATQNNEENIRKIADIAISNAKINSHEGLSDYEYTGDSIKEIEKQLSALKLEYTLDNDSYGFLGAIVTHTQLDLQKTIENIKDKNKTFLIITNSKTDNTEGILNILSAQGFKTENIKIVSKEDVQGAEADYAIAFNIEASNSTLSDLKEIYTLVTRGRYGFISFGSNDLFGLRGVSSTAEKPVVVISKNSETDRQAKAWLDTWRQAIDSTDNSKSKPELLSKSESIPETPVENEPEPENEEDRNQKTTTNISESFKDSDWLIGRQYGYMLGLSLNQINSIKNRQRIEWLTEVKNTSFGAFLKLLDSGSSLVWRDDQVELSEILKKSQPNGDLGKNYIDAYIRFVNIMRESYLESRIKGLSFLKLNAYGGGDSFDNPNISYLKYNDDPEKARGELRTFGIPVFIDGNIDGHIILGVLGYDVDESGKSSVLNTPWYNSLTAGNPVFKVVTNDKEKLDKHNANLEHYHQKAGHRTEISSRSKTHNGAIASITNLRDWSIITDWQGNISPEELKLGRMSVLELLDSGFEFVEGQSFNGGKGTNFAEFIKWYNSYRWSDVAKDKENQFASIIGHNGKYFVVRPKGTSGKGFPILIKKVTDWSTFINDDKTEGGYISAYTAKNIIYALAKFGLDSKYTLSDIEKFLLDDSKKLEKDLLFSNLVNSDSLKGYVTLDILARLLNCVLQGDKNRKYSKEVADNRQPTHSFSLNLMIWLNQNAKDFPYINVEKSTWDVSYIITKVFEPDNVLIDLSLLVDPLELQNTSIPEIQVVEWGSGLSETESDELNRLFNGVLSGNLFAVTAFNNKATVKRNIEHCILLLDKMSRENILTLEETLRRNLLNVINTLLGQGLNGRLIETLQKIESKIKSDKDISILCSI